MSHSDIGLALFMTCIVVTIAIFGSYVGYTDSGVQMNNPGVMGSLQFIKDMMLFQIDNMPFFINVIFDVMMVFYGWILYRAITSLIP